MAKRKTNASKKTKEVRAANPPCLVWDKTADGWIPSVYIANISFPLEERPFKGFRKGERDAILVWIKQALSDVLFGTPIYLVNDKNGAMAKNPDWDMLPFFMQDASGSWLEIEREPSDEQIAAGNQLKILDH